MDANVLLDLVTAHNAWSDWSAAELRRAAAAGPLFANDVVFAEVPIGFLRIEYAERVFAEAKVALAPMPRSALFRAGKAFREYRSRGGTRTGVLPDFFVGVHAAAAGRACSPATVAVTAATFPMSLSSSRPEPLPPAAPAG